MCWLIFEGSWTTRRRWLSFDAIPLNCFSYLCNKESKLAKPSTQVYEFQDGIDNCSTMKVFFSAFLKTAFSTKKSTNPQNSVQSICSALLKSTYTSRTTLSSPSLEIDAISIN
jgi:hypothetical protein